MRVQRQFNYVSFPVLPSDDKFIDSNEIVPVALKEEVMGFFIMQPKTSMFPGVRRGTASRKLQSTSDLQDVLPTSGLVRFR